MTAMTVLATAASKRVRLLQAARAQLGMPAARVLEWRDWLEQPSLLAQALDRVDLAPEPGQHRRLVARARADVEHAVARPDRGRWPPPTGRCT